VLKIRLSGRHDDDIIAWYYERSGVFFVRSAYKLALEIEQAETWHVGNSSRPDGARPLEPLRIPKAAEAEACLGVRLEKELISDSPVYIKTDCSSLVTSLRDSGFECIQWVDILSEMVGLSRLLPECIFQQVGRHANRVAQQLAKRAQEGHEWVVMRQEIPPEFRSLIISESARDVHVQQVCNMSSIH
jgi:hypothetical protein